MTPIKLELFKEFCGTQVGTTDAAGVASYAAFNCPVSITFDTENVAVAPMYEPGFAALLGYHLSRSGIPFLGALCGGDWEHPVFVIVYRDTLNGLAVYVPDAGNVYDRENKEAWQDEEDIPPNGFFDVELLAQAVDTWLKDRETLHSETHEATGNVLVSKEKYAQLLERDEILAALEQAGVKDWVRYEHAMKLHEEYKENVE